MASSSRSASKSCTSSSMLRAGDAGRSSERSTPRWSTPTTRSVCASRSPWQAMKSWHPRPGPPWMYSRGAASRGPQSFTKSRVPLTRMSPEVTAAAPTRLRGLHCRGRLEGDVPGMHPAPLHDRDPREDLGEGHQDQRRGPRLPAGDRVVGGEATDRVLTADGVGVQREREPEPHAGDPRRCCEDPRASEDAIAIAPYPGDEAAPRPEPDAD